MAVELFGLTQETKHRLFNRSTDRFYPLVHKVAIMTYPINKQHLFRIAIISAVVLPSILLQAEKSQAIPIELLLDSAGKAILQNIFRVPVEQPTEQQPSIDEDTSPTTDEISNLPATEDSEATSVNSGDN